VAGDDGGTGCQALSELIVGEHRYLAHKHLKRETISVTYTDVTDLRELRAMKITENLHRIGPEDWQEEARWTKEYHELTGKSLREVGEDLGRKTKGRISQLLTVARHLDDPRVAQCTNSLTAYNRATEIEAREKRVEPSILSPADDEASPIIRADFAKWAAEYTGPRFNALHCDFPFGIGAQDSGQNPAGYHDAPEVYHELCATLRERLDNFCAPDAHMLFWCASPIEKQYQTYRFLRTLPGFEFDDVPLIWHKPTGITPAHHQQPRRCYEVCFFGWRGNAKILQLRDNARAAVKSAGGHPHEKPAELLRYWFEMFVDSTTALLDPTCGGGTSLQAALACGASRVLGLELNPDTANNARVRLGGIAVDFRANRHPPPDRSIGLEDLGL
jgi:hypothetical protein